MFNFKRIRKLKEENAKLRKENEVLRKAIAAWANNNRKCWPDKESKIR